MQDPDPYPFGTRLDLLELDLPLSGLGICPIEECANETLITVAENLEQKSLATLALVSTRFSGVAQDVLYRCIMLPTPHFYNTRGRVVEFPSAIGLLWETLKRRPDLAQKVRSLFMWPLPESIVPYTIKGTEIACRTTMPAYLATKTLEAYIPEPAVAGLLLSMLPRLEELSFATSRHVAEVYKHCFSSILRPYGLSKLDIPLVPAFANLRNLSVQHGTIEWP